MPPRGEAVGAIAGIGVIDATDPLATATIDGPAVTATGLPAVTASAVRCRDGPDRSPALLSSTTVQAAASPAPEPKPKPKRLRAGRTHRAAVLASLPEEQRPVAEQVLRGGIPAVRQAVEKQNEANKVEGKPEISSAPLVALAEQLVSPLRTAEWHDKADAALADVAELDLRDLRSVVVAADAAARDEDICVARRAAAHRPRGAGRGRAGGLAQGASWRCSTKVGRCVPCV